MVGSAIFGGCDLADGGLPRPAVALLAPRRVLGVVPFLVEVANGWRPRTRVEHYLGRRGLFLFAAGWVAVGWSALRLDRAAIATATA